MGFLRDFIGAARGANQAGETSMPPIQNGTALGRRLFGNENAGHVSDIANRIGTGANMIAAGGGATPGYAAPQGYQEAQAAPVANHLQLLDRGTLDSILARFRPASTGVQY